MRMPVPKLQRFGSGRHMHEDRFIYDFGWPDEAPSTLLNRSGFDDSLVLQPGVGEWLVKLSSAHPTVLAQHRWTRTHRPPESEPRRRSSPRGVSCSAPTASVSTGYAGAVTTAGWQVLLCGRLTRRPDVDHFLPWSRHPDNKVDNLGRRLSRLQQRQVSQHRRPPTPPGMAEPTRRQRSTLTPSAASNDFARRQNRHSGRRRHLSVAPGPNCRCGCGAASTNSSTTPVCTSS